MESIDQQHLIPMRQPMTPTNPVITPAPVQIGPLTIDPPLFLAPMAGQTNHAFRTLCREAGDCGMVCTELISSQALQHKSSRSRTLQMFDWQPETESPFAVQLFGGDPGMMAEAAQLVVEHGADVVDINMGCWVPKVARKGGAGAALLRDVCSATAVVQAVVDAVDVPVTVKIRSGWTAADPTCVPFARAAADAGVSAIAVHARFADQGHSGDADWLWIRRVKDAVPHLPVIGNGDVWTGDDAARMMALTGCDGVMIGRAALGNPWVFHQIAQALRGQAPPPPPSPQAIAATALQQARLTLATTRLPQRQALLELRGQLLKYVEKLPQHVGAAARTALIRAEALSEVEAAFAPALLA